MTNLQKLEMLARSQSVAVGCVFECAVDNAGFDGFGGVLHTLSQEDHKEIIRHVAGIEDGRMLDYATEADWAEVRQILAA